MAEFLEAAMLICFGLSWPLNAYKGYRARTAVGTSWQFIALITAGYFAGIAAKLVSGNVSWVLVVYLVNVVCLGINWLVYFRNRRLDAMGEGACPSSASTALRMASDSVLPSDAAMSEQPFAQRVAQSS